mmetsp:Transcript_75862/g.180230  ORF Transcript_75862/g.180230 Transcript_75862/m.180230 type:complete len:417 (-) Transcript_75862:89-1339(-)
MRSRFPLGIFCLCTLLTCRHPASQWSHAPSRQTGFVQSSSNQRLVQSSAHLRQVQAEQRRKVARGTYPAPREGVDFEGMGFGLTTKDTQMAVAKCQLGDSWKGFEMAPYGPLDIEPAATALNYGQALFEGLKAYRTSKGRIVIFRPQENAKRMAGGGARLMIPQVPEKLFLEMCGAVVQANADWVPPEGQGELYLRPLLFGSGGQLGVGPSPEFTFVVYAAPVGKYFKGGGARMRLELEHHRAAPLGVGYVKAAGNYAPCFEAQAKAKADGFSDVIYLDVSGKNIEEAAASNFFCVRDDGTLMTPGLGTILAGVTRKSILTLGEQLAKKDGSSLTGVVEGDVTLEDVGRSTEAFVCGTGAGLTPIEEIHEVKAFDCPGAATKELQDVLAAVKMETDDAPAGFEEWLWDPWMDAPAK